MIVRQSQILQFEHDRRGLIVNDMFAFLRKEFAGESAAADDQKLLDFCQESVDTALTLGFDTFRSMAWFAATRLTIHPDFYKHEMLARLISEHRGSPETRIEQILAESTALDWEEARMMGPQRRGKAGAAEASL